MSEGTLLLCGTAGSIGLLHTLLGPDHYIPFVAMARARKWPLGKTMLITMLCGLGHVLSSVLLGLAGLMLGIAVFRIEGLESFRGEVAGWLLLSFGLAYFVWGVRRAIRHSEHSHSHFHLDGTKHSHEHDHFDEHVHVHASENDSSKGETGTAAVTPWVLFTIFLLGPCEPLIPLLMYPAAEGTVLDVIAVTSVFAFATLGTMLAVVAACYVGLSPLTFGRLERYSHALAGFAVLACGAAMTAGL